jgi:hypothetical protein
MRGDGTEGRRHAGSPDVCERGASDGGEETADWKRERHGPIEERRQVSKE